MSVLGSDSLRICKTSEPKTTAREICRERVEATELVGNGKRECPNCAVDVPRGSRRCPICGYEFPQPKSRLFKWIAIVLIILFLIPLVRLVIGLLK